MDTPIRVLQVVGNVGAGGLETLIMNWYRKIDRTKVQFDFLVHHKEKAFYEDEIISMGGKVYHATFLDDKDYFKYKRFLKTFFSEHKEYKVVHGHHSALGYVYLKAAKKAGIPVRISHSHIASFSKTLRGVVKYFITRNYGKYANIHFACSKAAGEYMYGKNSEYKVINNGIDTEKFRFRADVRERIREEWNLQDKLVIVHVGRFHDQKNHEFLIDIFSEIRKIHSNSILLMAGVGPLEETIKEKAAKLEIQDFCYFLGNRDDIEQILCAADIFVFPSLYEGLPLTLVEAQTSGLPVVCSNRITDETKLNENYIALPLESNSLEWAKVVLEQGSISIDRNNSFMRIRDKNYDSNDVTKQMQEFYLEQYL